MKVREVLKEGILKLNMYEIEDAFLKAQILLEYELGVSHEELLVNYGQEMQKTNVKKYYENIEKVIQGKPVQYITNHQSFYGLDFYVDENVLIPQPDTEILVEEVIKISRSRSQKPRILDICTGSGAIAIALDKNIEAQIMASDISKNAIEVAKKNALKHESNLEFRVSNLFENIEGKFDLVVSNPPYIETETIKNLSEEVKNEPILALDGGKDGLVFYRILAEKSREYLKNGGFLAVEIGYNQRRKVVEIFEKAGFEEVYAKRDFGGNERIIVGKWREICRFQQM